MRLGGVCGGSVGAIIASTKESNVVLASGAERLPVAARTNLHA